MATTETMEVDSAQSKPSTAWVTMAYNDGPLLRKKKGKKRNWHLKSARSITVTKENPYTFDLGHLLAQDPNPLVISKSENVNDSLKAVARDGAQVLINQLLVRPLSFWQKKKKEKKKRKRNRKTKTNQLFVETDYMPCNFEYKRRCSFVSSPSSHITTTI